MSTAPEIGDTDPYAEIDWRAGDFKHVCTPELARSLRSITEQLRKRPPELRGPFRVSWMQ